MGLTLWSHVAHKRCPKAGTSGNELGIPFQPDQLVIADIKFWDSRSFARYFWQCGASSEDAERLVRLGIDGPVALRLGNSEEKIPRVFTDGFEEKGVICKIWTEFRNYIRLENAIDNIPRNTEEESQDDNEEEPQEELSLSPRSSNTLNVDGLIDLGRRVQQEHANDMVVNRTIEDAFVRNVLDRMRMRNNLPPLARRLTLGEAHLDVVSGGPFFQNSQQIR